RYSVQNNPAYWPSEYRGKQQFYLERRHFRHYSNGLCPGQTPARESLGREDGFDSSTTQHLWQIGNHRPSLSNGPRAIRLAQLFPFPRQATFYNPPGSSSIARPELFASQPKFSDNAGRACSIRPNYHTPVAGQMRAMH